MKRMMHTLLFAFMFMLLCPAMVLSAEVYSEGYFKYQVENESVVICEYYGEETEVTVPFMMVGLPVSRIAKGAFADSSVVKKVNLPDTVMTVDEGAFAYGIQVIYNSNTDTPVASGTKNEGTAGEGNSTQGDIQSGDDPGIEEAEVTLDDDFFEQEEQSSEDVQKQEDKGKEDKSDKDTENESTESAGAKNSAVPVIVAVIIIVAAALVFFFWKKRKS